MNDELLNLMREKLVYLEKEQVLAIDSSQQFKLKKQIEELELAITGRQTHKYVVLDASVLHLKARSFFIGRDDELVCLGKAVENTMTTFIEGMGGVGKSYLVDRFAALSPQYPYQILSLNPLAEETVENLIAQLAERLRVNPNSEELRTQLRSQNVLLHVENVDTPEMSKVAMQLVAQLQGCRLVLSGRLKGLGRGSIFERIELKVFDLTESIAQLKQELEDLEAAPLPMDTLKKLVSALDGLPLAIHLCAGYLAEREAYCTADDFLRELQESKLRLESELSLDVCNRNLQHRTLHAAFSVSFLAFTRQFPDHATALAALGFSYARDIGFSLACTLLDVSTETAKTVLRQASKLGLLSELRGQGDINTLRWQIHPLIAEYFRAQVTDSQAIEQRLSNWFMQRLPEPDSIENYQAWHELNSEQDALRTWLERVPLEQGVTVERAGSLYADINGSWASWRQFCEKLLATGLSDEARSDVLWTACRCAARLGDLEQAYQFAEYKAQLDQILGNEREYALAKGQIADILEARGELDEALRIRQQEQMPVYERLGDVYSRAVTLGQIADILEARGELDEALRIRQQEEMPVYERLGDVYSRAVTLGKIADILQARGELNEALRIRQQEQMPVYERLGEVRSLLITQAKIALLLMKFTPPRREEANQLLCLALAAARKMRIPQEQWIEGILQRFEMDCLNLNSHN
ncbi:MAG: NB-ARC domain-containing protein [Thiotrichaceae bacterium]|nr:NB-ARC domain-containing protein [Thiotrichaceae bacterium]